MSLKIVTDLDTMHVSKEDADILSRIWYYSAITGSNYTAAPIHALPTSHKLEAKSSSYQCRYLPGGVECRFAKLNIHWCERTSKGLCCHWTKWSTDNHDTCVTHPDFQGTQNGYHCPKSAETLLSRDKTLLPSTARSPHRSLSTAVVHAGPSSVAKMKRFCVLFAVCVALSQPYVCAHCPQTPRGQVPEHECFI